jgi:hypothetical protein
MTSIEAIRLCDLDGYKDFDLSYKLKLHCLGFVQFCDSFIVVNKITPAGQNFIINGSFKLKSTDYIYIMPEITTYQAFAKDNGLFIPFEDDKLKGIFIDKCSQKDSMWTIEANAKKFVDIFAVKVDPKDEKATINEEITVRWMWMLRFKDIILEISNISGKISLISLIFFLANAKKWVV